MINEMLDEDLRKKLLLAATQARRRAYAPYSGDFKVGAAVLTEDGSMFSGCNIENASFGATVCAERVAVFKAVSEGHRNIRAVAVVTASHDPDPPCGLCLQVISEFGHHADVIMANIAGDTKMSNVAELLPRGFKFKNVNE